MILDPFAGSGTTAVVAVDYVRDSCVAMLAWEGLGADRDVWEALGQGYPNRDFGLHVSM